MVELMVGPDSQKLDALERAIQILIVKNVALIGQYDEKLAETVKRTQESAAGWSRVVVVGETKRGKSSLVNALMRQPGLSPVDYSVATSAFIEFRHGVRLTVRAYVAGREDPELVEVDRLSEWATLDGSRESQHPRARSVMVECDAPILRSGIVLVDTPGVGGLETSHGEITLEALRHASALLFVVDAMAEISDPEMKFLKQAAETVDLVLFALTKKDAVPEYEFILEGTRERVAASVPRLSDAPWFAVDSELARIALDDFGSGSEFDELWEQSCIPRLDAGLQTMVAARSSLLPLANGLRASDMALSEIDRRLTQQVALADPSAEEIEALTRERQELMRKTVMKKQRINHDLDVGIRRIRNVMNDRVGEEIDRLGHEWTKRLDQKKVDDSVELQEDLEADAEALFIRVHLDVTARLEGFLAEQLRTLPVLDEGVSIGTESPERDGHISSPEDAYSNTLERRVALITGVGGGLMIGRMALATVASLLGVAAGLAAPLGLVLGFGVSHVFHRLRTQQMTKQQQRQWMLSEIGRLRTDILTTSERFLAAAQEAFYPIVMQAIESLDVELQDSLAQLDRLNYLDRTERQRRKRDAESARQVIERQWSDTQTLLQRIEIDGRAPAG